MKSLNLYINESLIAGKETFESLFDDEDDLLNKIPSTAVDWLFDKDNAHIVYNGFKTITREHRDVIIYNSKGELSVAQDKRSQNHLLIFLHKPLPNFIRFDEDDINNGYITFAIKYDVKSQKDIPLAGVLTISGDMNNLTVRTNPLNYFSKLFMYKCNSIKNFTIETPRSISKLVINIPTSKIQLKDLTEIKISSAKDKYYQCACIINTSESCPNIRKVLYKICKDYICKDHESKVIPWHLFGDIQPHLKKMYDNGINHIIYMRSQILRMTKNPQNDELRIRCYAIDKQTLYNYERLL